MQFRIAGECRFDIAEETAADDAATPPHQRDIAVTQLPPIFGGGFTHQHITLSVGDDLGGIERIMNGFKGGRSITLKTIAWCMVLLLGL